MPVWKYNGNCYLKINGKQVTDYAVDKSKTEGDIEVSNSLQNICLTYYI